MNRVIMMHFNAKSKELLSASGDKKLEIETDILKGIEKEMEADNGVETVQNTKKRESANVSNYSTFEGYVKPVEVYVLKSDNPSPLQELADDVAKIDKKKDEDYLHKMKLVISKMNKIASSYADRPYLSRSIDREASFF